MLNSVYNNYQSAKDQFINHKDYKNKNFTLNHIFQLENTWTHLYLIHFLLS